ncbi:MAG: hypothetical protein ACHQAY_16525 [Hyphomicrobiales bacterium]
MAIAMLLVASGAVADAVSVKSVMRAWKGQNRVASALIGGKLPYDETAARAILNAYIADGADIAARLSGTTSQARDIKARFEELATDARSAMASTSSRDAFRLGYPKVAGNCRSCHDAYAN